MNSDRYDILAGYKPVETRWSNEAAPTDPVDLLVYRSNLLGTDSRITNYAGGNTSYKAPAADRVTGDLRSVLWVKGSGGDLGALARSGLAVLDNDRVLALQRGYRGVEKEDERFGMLAPPPSIDTPLHAVVPHAHVDHVHPDAIIAFATAQGGRQLTEEVFAGDLGWLEWQRPGFDLALKLQTLIADNPSLRGAILGGHGLITWADDAKTCYELTLNMINRAASHIENVRSRTGVHPFGAGAPSLPSGKRKTQAERAFPILIGIAASYGGKVVGDFRDEDGILAFGGSENLARLAAEGTSCPDHFLRTRRVPLVLQLPSEADPVESREYLASAFAQYHDAYSSYYRANTTHGSPPMRGSSPVIVLWPGVGMFSLGISKRDARIAGDFYASAINVMRGAETMSRYQGLSEQEAFRIEYWALEEAKLQRQRPEGRLSRRVALITGGSGGIGSAIARRFAGEGASVVVTDVDLAGAEAIVGDIGEQGLALALDVTNEADVDRVMRQAARHFGAVDIVVNNAGIGLSAPITETSVEDFDRVGAVIERGSFLLARAFARQTMQSKLPGDLIYICSKNAVFAGPNNVAYSGAKAAQLHQVRLLAVELAPAGIRVNGVNPDAVVRGSKIFAGSWGEDRAATYGVPISELGRFYAERTLLKMEILPEDVAAAAFALVGGDLPKTTGHVIPVDGGVPAAFLR